MNEQVKPTKIEPGSDMHFALLGAEFGYNFLQGDEYRQMQAFAKKVWVARAEPARPPEVVPVTDAEREELRRRMNEKMSPLADPHHRWLFWPGLHAFTSAALQSVEEFAASRVPVASVVGWKGLSDAERDSLCAHWKSNGRQLCLDAEAILKHKNPSPAPGGAGGDVGAIKELLEKLLLEAELFWWNDGPKGKSASDMHKARDAVLAHVYALATPAAEQAGAS